MDFSIPGEFTEEILKFKDFLKARVIPELPAWYQNREIPARIFKDFAAGGWYGIESKDQVLGKRPALRQAMVAEELAKVSPGVAVALLVQVDLGLVGLFLFGSEDLKRRYGAPAARGEILMCLGNSEPTAGSDAAAIETSARKVSGGWILNGTKAYVTNGYIGDLAIITAVSEPNAPRNERISMFLVDLNSKGVKRKKLNKQVWIPSDLTRLQLDDVFVPEDRLLGSQGKGLRQVLTIFTHSRVPISAGTLGTATGAFELALEHARKRKIFGRKITDFQAKAFEASDFYAKIEAARLMLWKACWKIDRKEEFRKEASLAKYLTVEIARNVSAWAADIFGAASVIGEHPIHKFPMDAWAASLGEGTQDVQKLVIFRELMKQFQ